MQNAWADKVCTNIIFSITAFGQDDWPYDPCGSSTHLICCDAVRWQNLLPIQQYAFEAILLNLMIESACSTLHLLLLAAALIR